MEKKTVPAKIEYLEEVLGFVDGFLRAANCSEEQKYCIDVSVEEIFTNIASYAYHTDDGHIEMLCWFEEPGGGSSQAGVRELSIQLTDRGTPYDPWSKKDPDFKVPFDERPIGGLGIYMTKKFMDRVEYRYENGCNVTTLRKVIGGSGNGGNV